ncbi:Tumor necrosis factor ligand superfamily member 13 [Papilio machaon]|uniref:Tumor necrosis factor ligand superfamily member 13 n=1 Tax=Papilio machaon TaxID=76193 RepID=A0A0N0PAL9_PAPMA|nr:Tumor necrosis factor ligand superfamily member 13 [Papilio machaon]
MADDEDMYDGDEDAESGDWYPDYYKQGPKIGTTNMVRLKPEDFTDAVLPADKERQIPIPNITEIKRLLNENPELTDIDLPTMKIPTKAAAEEVRVKRSVFPDAAADAIAEMPVPKIISKSDDRLVPRIVMQRTSVSVSANLPTMKIPTKAAAEEVRVKRSVFPDAAADAIAEMPVPKIISKSDDRRKMKKFISSTDSSIAEKMSLHTVTRTARNSEDGDGRRRPFIAAHFHGNTSHLSPEIHEHYKGNGLVSVAHDAPHDVWYPSPWTLASPHPRPTLTRAGHVHVHHTGVYLVYVQIYYLDSHDVISWVLHRTNPEIEGRETLLQCAQSAHSPEPLEKPNSCFSAAALFLRAGDKLAVRNTGGNRHSLMQPEKSFIGLIKLADAEEPNQEL